MNRKNILVYAIILFLTACGYGREEDKELKRREELQELSEEMENSLARVRNLKIQLRDSLDRYAGQEDSLSRVRGDRYRLLMSELEQAEEGYQNWQQEIEYEPSNMSHEETMEYYSSEEDKAEALRQDIRQTVEYVESEIQK